MKKVRSTLNCTPHCLATCSICGEQGGSSMDADKARRWLKRHMIKENHKYGSVEVGRVSQYELFIN